MFIHTGDYYKHQTEGVSQSVYFTFTPIPLMNGNFFTMNDELAGLIAKTHRVLGILEGMRVFLSGNDWLAELMLFRESCFSKMIDYPDCDIQTLLVEKAGGKDISSVMNIMAAYRNAIEPYSKSPDFDAIATFAMHGKDSSHSVAVRDKPLFLTQSISNYQEYNPTAPDNLRVALRDIADYVDKNNADVLIKAAMCHYQFEIVHPYACNNGIVGRILPYHILTAAGTNCAGLLCLSASLYRHKDVYFNMLRSTQRNGNYDEWISFYISTMHEAAAECISFIRFYTECTDKDEELIHSRRQKKQDCVPGVYRYFSQNIISTIGTASKQLGLTYSAVSRSMAILHDLGVLTQVNHGARNRLFAHNKILQRFVLPEYTSIT